MLAELRLDDKPSEDESCELCSGDWWNCISKGDVAGALVILALLFFFAFALGQDHPKPGTVITDEVSQRLLEADQVLAEKEGLEQEVESLSQEVSYLEDRLAKKSGEDWSPIQIFLSGPDYNTEYRATNVTPFGINILVESRWLNRPRVFALEDKFQEQSLDAKVQLEGQEPVKLPTNHDWVRLNNLLIVRLSPNNETKYLGYAYPKGINGPVLTYTYRALEASISPTISTY